MNVALFCVFRNEHIYINEFIEHYLNLGFNHIYLIDNSSNDKLDNILNPKFKSDVSIIDIRSENVIDNFSDYQIKLYTSLYNIFNFKYDWLAFFDIDEFLILHKDNNIQEYLNRDIFKNVDQIHVNWIIFDDNDQLHYSPGSLIERFPRISKKFYDLYGPYANGVKSILRSNLDLKFLTMHTAISNTESKLITTDNDGNSSDEYYSSHRYASYEYAQLNHYITKSTEEYLTKNRHNQWDFYERYFQINEYTEEKAQMLEELKSS